MRDGSKADGPFDSTIFSAKSEILINNLYMIRKAPSGGYLLWSCRDLLRVKELIKDPVSLNNGLSLYIRASCSRNGYFYIIGMGRYILKYRDEHLIEFTEMPFSIYYTMSRKNALLFDRDGYFWVGTFDDGLYCLNGESIVQQQQNKKAVKSQNPIRKTGKIIQHLDIRQVNSIIQDHEGNIWISSSEDGVYKISSYLNSHRHYENELFQNKGIIEMAAALQNGMWLSNGRTIYLLLAKSIYTLGFQEKNTSFNVIYHLKTNKLILGEKYSYFYIINDVNPDHASKKANFSSVDTSISYMSGITVNTKEDKINCYNYFNFDLIDPDTLFGMYKSGFFQKDYNVGSRINYTYYNNKDELIINARKNYVLQNDTFLVANEISRFDNKSITQHINLNSTTELFNIENENIYLYYNNKFYDLSASFAIPANLKIKSITYHEPVLYLANAINIYKCSNPLHILEGKPVNLKMIDINYRNIHKILAINDSLYIASDDGLTVIPEKLVDSIASHIPIPYIESILVNDKEADITNNKLSLVGNNTLKFIFSSINYTSTPVFYSYMLEGADPGWTSGTGNIVSYQNLHRGSYIFKLRISKPNSEWSKPLEFNIVIKPRLWQHPAFIGFLIILFIALLALIIFRIINNKIKRREMDHQMITLEQKALQSMMNPHFIFNALGSIQNYLLQNKPGEAGLYLSQFARLIRQNLSAINSSMINLEEETDRLKNYLDLERLRMENKFEYTIEIDEDVEEDELMIHSMIIQPFVENAIWHGIAALEEKGMIRISFAIHSIQSLKITIEDNGVGIKQADVYTAKSENHLHMGMAMTQKRLEIIGRKMNVETSVVTSEVMSGNINPGTRVVIIVPVSYSSADLL